MFPTLPWLLSIIAAVRDHVRTDSTAILKWTKIKLVVLNTQYWQWVNFLQAGRPQDSLGVGSPQWDCDPSALPHLAGALETPSLGIVCEPASPALAGNYDHMVNELLEPPGWVLVAAVQHSLIVLGWCFCSMDRGVLEFGTLKPLPLGKGVEAQL